MVDKRKDGKKEVLDVFFKMDINNLINLYFNVGWVLFLRIGWIFIAVIVGLAAIILIVLKFAGRI